MTQTSRLVIEIDSTAAQRNADLFNAELQRMTTGGQRAASSIDHLGSEANSTAKELDATSKAVRSLVGYIGGMAAVSKAIALADEYSQMASRIRNATESVAEYNLVQERLLQTANNTYRPLKEAQEVFLGTADTLKDLGYTTSQALDVADSLSYSFVINATASDTAATALDNYSKSMITGKVSSDAFIAITGAADNIIGDLAAQTGKTASEIKKLGIEGKLSLTDLNETLRLTKDQNLELAQAMSTSVADGFQALTNSVGAFLGKSNEAYGVTGTLAAGLGELAKHLDFVANTGASLAVGYLTKTIIASTVAGYEKGKELLAQRAATVAQAQANVQLTTTEVARTAATVAGIQADIALAEAHVLTLTGTQRLAYMESTLIPLRNSLTAATAANTAAEVANTEARLAQVAASSRSASAMAGLSAILGGPAGLIGLAVAAGAAFYLMRDSSDEATPAIDRQGKSVADLAKEYKSLSLAQAVLESKNLREEISKQGETADDARASLNKYLYIQKELFQLKPTQVVELRDLIENVGLDAKKGAIALEGLKKSGRLEQDIIDQFAKFVAVLESSKTKTDQAKAAQQLLLGITNNLTTAANGATDAIKNQGDAAQTTAGQFNEATEALKKYLSQQQSSAWKTQFAATYSAKNNLPTDFSNMVAEARQANDNKPLTQQQTNDLWKYYQAQQAVTELDKRRNDAIKAGEKAVTDREKAEKKSNDASLRAAEELQRRFDDLVLSRRSDTEVIEQEYNKNVELIKTFTKAGSSEQNALLVKEGQIRQQGLTEAKIALADRLYAYTEYATSEETLVVRHYQKLRDIALADAKLNAKQKEFALDNLDKEEQQQLAQIKLRNDMQVLSAQQGYMTEAGYMQERYKLEREEIQKNLELSEEYRKKLLEINQANIFAARNQAGAAVGGIQQRFNEALMQRDNPRGYAQYQLQNQYETDSGALSGAYRNNQDAINNDPLLDQQQKEQQLLDAHQQYLSAKAAMDAEYNQQQQDLLNQQQAANLATYSNIFGDLSGLAKAFGGEQSSTYRVLFAAQKGFALSSALVNNWKTISDAYANEPGTIWNKIAAGVVAASETGVFSAAIQAITPQGFSAGGYTGPGGKYDVAGLVHKGEVVWSQDDIKRAGGVGTVEAMRTGTRVDNAIAAQGRSSGSGGNVYVYNNTSSAVSTRKDDSGNTYITIDDVRKEIDSYVPAQLARPNSSISKGLKRNYNTETRR